METGDCPVIVVGASLVGLSMTTFLSAQGIEVTVLEKHARISAHSRLQAVSPRTMEILGAPGQKVRSALTRLPTPATATSFRPPRWLGRRPHGWRGHSRMTATASRRQCGR